MSFKAIERTWSGTQHTSAAPVPVRKSTSTLLFSLDTLKITAKQSLFRALLRSRKALQGFHATSEYQT
jgi:hypothetical protein